MSLRIPSLETARLRVREFTMSDLDAISRLRDAHAEFGVVSVGEHREWLEWTIASYAELDQLRQPPYGDRAIALRDSDDLVGAVGLVPCLAPFAQIFDGFTQEPFDGPSGRDRPDAFDAPSGAGYTPEVGLYWAVLPAYRRRGYASEAAAALVAYAFDQLHLSRVVALTTFDNEASIGVMRKLGMRIERNPQPEPEWLQVVGVRHK